MTAEFCRSRSVDDFLVYSQTLIARKLKWYILGMLVSGDESHDGISLPLSLKTPRHPKTDVRANVAKNHGTCRTCHTSASSDLQLKGFHLFN